MKKKIDVTALGEILIDFTFAGKSSAGKNIFEENPGGAPANCACAVSKLGGKSAFIGMTGEDSSALISSIGQHHSPLNGVRHPAGSRAGSEDGRDRRDERDVRYVVRDG